MQWFPFPNNNTDEYHLCRFGHIAVRIDARNEWGTELIVVFGGVVSTSRNSTASTDDQHAAIAEVIVLNIETNSWFRPSISVNALYPEARAFHCAASLGNKIYVFGGHVLQHDTANKRRRTFFSDIWCLNTETWQWTRNWVLVQHEGPCKRDMATLTHVGGNQLLLIGGRNEAGRAMGDMWLFDVEKSKWTPCKIPGPAPIPRKMHAAVFVGAGCLILLGGERDVGALDDLWSLKGLDGSEPLRWTQIHLKPCPPARFGHAIALNSDSHAIMMFGGCLDSASGSFFALTRSYVQTNESWSLDLASFSWTRVGNMSLPRSENLHASDAAVSSTPPRPSGSELDSLLPSPGSSHTPHHHSGSSSSSRTSGGSPLIPLPRMCHTLTAVSGGRTLMVGGRRKEGVCQDGCWWLSSSSALASSPTDEYPAAQAEPDQGLVLCSQGQEEVPRYNYQDASPGFLLTLPTTGDSTAIDTPSEKVPTEAETSSDGQAIVTSKAVVPTAAVSKPMMSSMLMSLFNAPASSTSTSSSATHVPSTVPSAASSSATNSTSTSMYTPHLSPASSLMLRHVPPATDAANTAVSASTSAQHENATTTLTTISSSALHAVALDESNSPAPVPCAVLSGSKLTTLPTVQMFLDNIRQRVQAAEMTGAANGQWPSPAHQYHHQQQQQMELHASLPSGSSEHKVNNYVCRDTSTACQIGTMSPAAVHLVHPSCSAEHYNAVTHLSTVQSSAAASAVSTYAVDISAGLTLVEAATVNKTRTQLSAMLQPAGSAAPAVATSVSPAAAAAISMSATSPGHGLLNSPASSNEAADRARQGLLILGRQLLQAGDEDVKNVGAGRRQADNKMSGIITSSQDEIGEEKMYINAARRYLRAFTAEDLPLGLLQLVLDDFYALRAWRQRSFAAAALESLFTTKNLDCSPAGCHHEAAGLQGGFERSSNIIDTTSTLTHDGHDDHTLFGGPRSVPSPLPGLSPRLPLAVGSARTVVQDLLLGLIDLSCGSSTSHFSRLACSADSVRMMEVPLLLQEYRAAVATIVA
ncbi:hypothetical protein CEUSTIGMA_g11606.t1 [Chlamydomonas eustigma]|uniref:Uncharacterized protein n=1 Tax=Chlamydomonas eustigma TaxID=1157962 RepID=A0A250XMD1_9CHLO|nr:hypothetical protein CEUSTIGMA_g11606.t1 [Chlamydomonas eustigma]|eukprot:GAX84183.1 hypothetical protein CEUSTIGMA_g11606.t1 [Chlamydomonas eustigma]